MRILYLAPYVPGRSAGGSSIVSYNTLKRLTSKHELMLLCLTNNSEFNREAVEELEELNVRVHAVMIHTVLNSFSAKLQSLLVLEPYSLQAYGSMELRREFDSLLRIFEPDIIHVDLLHMMWCANRTTTPLVFYTHNVEADRYLSQVRVRHLNMLQRTIHRWDYFRTYLAERNACRKASWALAVTEEDTGMLKQKYGVKHVSTVKPGVDLDLFPALSDADCHRIVFAGSMFYEPNVDAMLWFCREVLPVIREQLPETHLTIVGREPAPEIQALGDRPEITVTGSVPSVTEYFAQATIGINPLRIGGGIKQKLLEAMAMQRAVVTTSFGAIGIPVRHMENVLVADDAESFAQACIWLLTHPKERTEIALKARRLIEQNFSWETALSQIEAIYDRVIGLEEGNAQ